MLDILEKKRGWMPNEDECRSVLSAERMSKDTREHSMRVKNHVRDIVNEALDNGWPINMPVAITGAWLHDSGKHEDQKLWVHAYNGYELLKNKYRINAEVYEIAKRHIAMPEEWVRKLDINIPVGDYMPHTVEQYIVCYCDKMDGEESVREYIKAGRKFFNKNFRKDFSKFHGDFSITLTRKISKYRNEKYHRGRH